MRRVAIVVVAATIVAPSCSLGEVAAPSSVASSATVSTTTPPVLVTSPPSSAVPTTTHVPAQVGFVVRDLESGEQPADLPTYTGAKEAAEIDTRPPKNVSGKRADWTGSMRMRIRDSVRWTIVPGRRVLTAVPPGSLLPHGSLSWSVLSENAPFERGARIEHRPWETIEASQTYLDHHATPKGCTEESAAANHRVFRCGDLDLKMGFFEPTNDAIGGIAYYTVAERADTTALMAVVDNVRFGDEGQFRALVPAEEVPTSDLYRATLAPSAGVVALDIVEGSFGGSSLKYAFTIETTTQVEVRNFTSDTWTLAPNDAFWAPIEPGTALRFDVLDFGLDRLILSLRPSPFAGYEVSLDATFARPLPPLAMTASEAPVDLVAVENPVLDLGDRGKQLASELVPQSWNQDGHVYTRDLDANDPARLEFRTHVSSWGWPIGTRTLELRTQPTRPVIEFDVDPMFSAYVTRWEPSGRPTVTAVVLGQRGLQDAAHWIVLESSPEDHDYLVRQVLLRAVDAYVLDWIPGENG